jgi:hypothetical protein
MAEEDDFEQLVGWIGRFNDCVGQVVEEINTTLTLVDSAEYELRQVRRQLRPSSQLPKEALTTLCEPGRTPKGVFNVKLRSPENIRTPQWWAVLGLGE